MSPETIPVTSGARTRGPGARWLLLGATLLMCLAVVARAPLWGALAWGVHQPLDLVGNLPLLGALALLFWVHWRWTRDVGIVPTRRAKIGRASALGALMLTLSLTARVGENAGFGRLAILTVNPASGGFFEAAYDSQGDPNWLRNYPDLMKRYHHVHSHPPAPVGLMRWWLAHKSPVLTEVADNFLAIAPGTNAAALGGFGARSRSLRWCRRWAATRRFTPGFSGFCRALRRFAARRIGC